MIDDEARIGHRRDEHVRSGQFARADQQVVNEVGVGDGRDPPPHVITGEPSGVGLVVDLVADPDEPIATRAVS